MRTFTAAIALSSGVALAGNIPTPFTETFDLGGENWRQGDSSDVDWNSGVASTTVDLNTAGPFGLTLFRAQDGFDSSNDAFVGNYIAGGIDTLSFDIRHDAGVDLGFSVRFATSANSPAFVLFAPQSVVSGEWTTLTFAIDPNSPFYSPAGGTYEAVAPQVGNLQIFAARPDGLTTPLVSTFEIDNVAITPTPASAALLGLGGVVAARRRRA
ncbi:MAG: hypothetical protein AAGA55_02820 [Planctomycetota bacterium]